MQYTLYTAHPERAYNIKNTRGNLFTSEVGLRQEDNFPH